MVDKADISVTLEDLNPVEEYPYATYIEGRTNGGYGNGQYPFRRHKTLAQAKSSITLAHDIHDYVEEENGKRRYVGSRRPETHVYKWGDEPDYEWIEVFL